MADVAINGLGTGRSFTIRSLLRPLLGHPRASQAIKWIVYASLVVNFGVYGYDDWLAFRSSLAADAPWTEILETFSTTVDMAAWLGLIALYELDTYALPEDKYTRWAAGALLAGRLVCGGAIVYAVFGYTAGTLDYYNIKPIPGLTDLCQLADRETALQIDTITYVQITAANCSELSAENTFYQVASEISVIDYPTIEHSRWLGWVDVLNASVWLIVVLLIEIEVRLQAVDRFSGRVLNIARPAKTFCYGILILNGLIWIATGYPIYAWDAFLWIFGFWAIELNLAEWEQERVAELAAAESAAYS